MQITGSCPGFPSIIWAMGKLPLASLQGENLPGKVVLRFPRQSLLTTWGSASSLPSGPFHEPSQLQA